MPLDQEQQQDIKRISVQTDVAIPVAATSISITSNDTTADTTLNIETVEAKNNITLHEQSVNQSIQANTIELSERPSLTKVITINKGGTITSNHNELSHLDYAHSGHTGFASEEALRSKQDKLVAGPTLVIKDNTIDSRFSLTDVIIDF